MKKGVIVLDIGKTSAKVSYIDTDGHVVGRWERPNASVTMDGLMRLDAVGIESWLGGAIAEMARVGEVGAIVPVAHGAAAAILRGNVLAMPPLDYEQEIPADLSSEYRSQRDPFAMTGSPALPNGLNLGTQLHLLEKRYPDLLSPDATILTWPQYWAWRLGAGAACELTSLGCHSDLWWPTEGKPSALATRRGWAARLAPIRGASEVLGHLSAEWIKRTGLPASTEIRCGLHDSNAALVAMRDSTATDEFTLLSTGTWFIAMRSPGVDAVPCLADLDERRDCLVNIDTRGHLIPSSRFMGGREIQLLL